MNLLTKQKESHRCRKLTYGYLEGKGGRNKLGDWGIYIYILEREKYTSKPQESKKVGGISLISRLTI